MKPWTAKETQRLKELYVEGLDEREIARIMGRSYNSVSSKVFKLNADSKVVGSRRAFNLHVMKGSAEFSGDIPHGLKNEDEVIKYIGLDPKQWKIGAKGIIYGESEAYRKDRRVEWDVEDGKVVSGKVRDSGKILIEPLISVKVFLEKRTKEINAEEDIEYFRKKANKYSPKYKTIKYKKVSDGVMYEIQMPDLQLGRMVMREEAGADLNPDIAVKTARSAINELLGYSKIYKIERVIFPAGNDFFDVNNADGKTAHGTPQRDDPRWQRTYKLGKDLLIEAIEAMSTIAPVLVPVIVGNHDEERMWYLGDTLASWFRLSKNVEIDNREKKRKVYPFGKCLLGLTHGYWEPLKDLPHLMATEERELWGKSIYREWHVGDKHHKDEKIIQVSKEYPGTVVRIIRSLATPSVWEYDKGFIGTVKAAESFVWHKERGIIGQFTGMG